MKLSTFIYIASFLDGVDDVARLLAFFAAIGCYRQKNIILLRKKS